MKKFEKQENGGLFAPFGVIFGRLNGRRLLYAVGRFLDRIVRTIGARGLVVMMRVGKGIFLKSLIEMATACRLKREHIAVLCSLLLLMCAARYFLRHSTSLITISLSSGLRSVMSMTILSVVLIR